MHVFTHLPTSKMASKVAKKNHETLLVVVLLTKLFCFNFQRPAVSLCLPPALSVGAILLKILA